MTSWKNLYSNFNFFVIPLPSEPETDTYRNAYKTTTYTT